MVLLQKTRVNNSQIIQIRVQTATSNVTLGGTSSQALLSGGINAKEIEKRARRVG